MSINSKYDSLLFQESKRGRNNSYINLATIYLHKIFSLIFELIPIKEQVVRLSSEVLSEVWFGLEKIEDLNGFNKCLERTAILKCVDFLSKNNIELLNDDSINNLCSELNVPILPIEREILKLNVFERICVILVDQVGLNIDFVSRLCNDKELNEILETLNNARQKLIKKFPSEIYTQFNAEQWNQINSYLKVALSEEKLEINENLMLLVSHYEASSVEIMQDLFRHLVPDQKIIEYLVNIILDQKPKIPIETKVIEGKNNSKKLLKIIIPIGVVIVLVALFFIIAPFSNPNESPNKLGVFLLKEGANAQKELNPGESIKTSSFEVEKIRCNDLATIEVLKNTELEFGKENNSEIVFNLKYGSINFNSAFGVIEKYEQKGFNLKIVTSNATLTTAQSEFAYSITKDSDSYLVVNEGWLSVKINNYNQSIYCADNYNLKNNGNYKLIIPYHKSSSKEFQNAIENISILPTDDESFNFIINNVEEKDALTLWHLLSISEKNKRKIILEKMDKILLMDLVEEADSAASLSEKTKHNLLKFIISDLLMRSDE